MKKKENLKKNVHLTEDLETQAVGVKLPAEESTQVDNQEGNCKTGFGAGGAVEQLTVEEKNISQAKCESYDDDTSDEEDFTPAAEELPIKENKLQYMNIDEVSWANLQWKVILLLRLSWLLYRGCPRENLPPIK